MIESAGTTPILGLLWVSGLLRKPKPALFMSEIGENMTLLLMLLACGEKEQADDSSSEATQQEDTGVEA